MTELRSVGLADIALAATRQAMRESRFALPGRIESYDASTQKASVHPLIADSYFDETGERQVSFLPVVSSVPVVFPSAGGYRMTFPVQVGDSCLLIFSDRSLETWLDQGGAVDPIDPRMHDKSDAIAIIGLRDFGHPLAGARGDAMTLGKDGGPQIHIEAGAIKLGGQGATQPLVLGTNFKAALDAFATAVGTFAGHAVGPTPDQLAALTAAITTLGNAVYLSNMSKTL